METYVVSFRSKIFAFSRKYSRTLTTASIRDIASLRSSSIHGVALRAAYMTKTFVEDSNEFTRSVY